MHTAPRVSTMLIARLITEVTREPHTWAQTIINSLALLLHHSSVRHEGEQL